jgi:hypothetical protein
MLKITKRAVDVETITENVEYFYGSNSHKKDNFI